jgi:hypothetical protein
VAAPTIDPTANVRELVEAESRHRDALREADNKYRDAMREAETKRVDQLAEMERTFNLEMAKVLRANQDAASTLLATQLKEVKTDLSDRTAKLEQFRYETSGKTSGKSDLWGWVFGGVSLIIASGTFFVLVSRGHIGG